METRRGRHGTGLQYRMDRCTSTMEMAPPMPCAPIPVSRCGCIRHWGTTPMCPWSKMGWSFLQDQIIREVSLSSRCAPTMVARYGRPPLIHCPSGGGRSVRSPIQGAELQTLADSKIIRYDSDVE